ncbi:MAG: SUMF1/EgtB/PvdO family nonheme iron enzyme [Polyangiales bacterium]
MRSAVAGTSLIAALGLLACGVRTPPSHDQTPVQVTRVEVATVEARAYESAERAPCAEGMVLVDGEHCSEVDQRCVRWLDPPGRYEHFRCAEYAQPSVCRGTRSALRYCIDVDEAHHAGESLPESHVTFKAAERACAERGARLCTEREFELACEGPELRPYPYGFARAAGACNVDRADLGRPGHGLHDLRTATGANDACVSSYGVRDLVGNVEEWARRDEAVALQTHTKQTLLMGSWWMPGRSTCRGVNGGHEATYEGPETGYRCCANPR